MTTFQDVPFISKIFRSVEPKLSYHLHFYRTFKSQEFSLNMVSEIEKLVLPGGGRVGVGRADEEQRKFQKININSAISILN